MRLIERTFNKLTEGSSGDLWLYWSQLLVLYSSPDRHYHTFSHLKDVIKKLNYFLPKRLNNKAIYFAALYHDAVYNTRLQNNEEMSANLAQEALQGMGFSAQVRFTKALILATKNHTIPDSIDGINIAPDTQEIFGYFLDADLAILGKGPEKYKQYAENIRKEYEWVPEALFKVKRSEILQELLTKPSIYNTLVFRNTYELKARSNIQWELDQLNNRNHT